MTKKKTVTPASAEPKNPARSAFNKALCGRVRALRESMKHPDGSKWTIPEMAELMSVGEEAWRSYETYVPIPHYLIPRFARIVAKPIEYVLTGTMPRPVIVVQEEHAD